MQYGYVVMEVKDRPFVVVAIKCVEAAFSNDAICSSRTFSICSSIDKVILSQLYFSMRIVVQSERPEP